MDSGSNFAADTQDEEAREAELGPQLRKVAMAARALWPDGRVPTILGVRERNRRLREWCLLHGLRNDELLYRYFRRPGRALART
jgi:hypothetical protein